MHDSYKLFVFASLLGHITFEMPQCSLVSDILQFHLWIEQRAHPPSAQKEMVSASDEDAIADVMEQHDQFLASMQSHLLKLQVSS